MAAMVLRWVRPLAVLLVLAIPLATTIPAPPRRRTPAPRYVNSVNGSDAADGTSPATAFRTLGRAQREVVQPGGTVYLARGSVWREQLPAASGSSGAGPVTYGSYGPKALPKPMLLGSVSAAQPDDWEAEAPNVWTTKPRQTKPAPGAHNLVPNPAFAQGLTGWGLWTEALQPGSSVVGALNTTAPRTPPAAYQITWSNMAGSPAAFTQLYAYNVTVEQGKLYNLTFWAQCSANVTLSNVLLFSLNPPYRPYAAPSGPVRLKASRGWLRYSLLFEATVSATDARVTWLFDNRAGTGGLLPSDLEVSVDSASLLEVVSSSLWFPVDVGNVITLGPAGELQAGTKVWAADRLQSEGDFLYDNVTHQLKVYTAHGNPAVQQPDLLECALTQDMVTFNGASHVVFEGLHLRFGGAHGFNGDTSDHIVIRDCDIDWVGGGVLFYSYPGRDEPVRYGNGIQFWCNASNHLVYNNRLSNIYDTALTNQATGPGCFQVNISYYNNLAWNCAMACAEIWNSDPSGVLADIRFVHNVCANIGDGGWSQGQRPDKAGRSICFYNNLARAEHILLTDNVFFQSVGFQALLYMSNPWSTWAAGALQSDRNDWFAMEAGTLASAALIMIAPGQPQQEVYNRSTFAAYTRGKSVDTNSLLADPLLDGFPAVPANLSDASNCLPTPGSPVLGKGAVVTGITEDFQGITYGTTPNLGAFQHRAAIRAGPAGTVLR